MPKSMMTTEEYIEKARRRHGDKFDYSKTVYSGSFETVTIICPEHGEFTTTASTHINSRKGSGCSECARNVRRTGAEEFFRRCREVHGDRFDYSQTEFKAQRLRITVRCKEHDQVFTQVAQSHMIGKVGCTQCNGQSPLTLEQFIERSKEKHGQDKFDYSKVEKFSNMHNKITLICRTHQEEFRIEINSHLNGTNSCPQCNKFSRYTRKKLLSRVEQTYPSGRYLYDKTDHQEGVKNPVTITCGIDGHGDFQQSLDAHLAGKQGCKKCTLNGTSAREKQVGDFLDSLGISYESNNRKILNGKELDFYMPENKVAIEFNGVYWHQEKFKGKNFHSQKYWDCHDQGIQLLTVWEDDWMNKPDVIQRHIAHILGRSNEERVFARRTHTDVVGKSEAQDFHSLHHIQGYVNSSVHYALRKDDGTIVALMSLLKTRNTGEWVLTRYSTSVHVVGGHSKLLKRFITDQSPKKITTFADLSFSNGDLYDKTGWTRDKLLDPDYHYVIGGVLRQHKFGFRKKRFENDPDLLFDPDMTEAQLAELNNIGRIWDCGKIRYVVTF